MKSELTVGDRVAMRGASPWGGKSGAKGSVVELRGWAVVVRWDGGWGLLSTWERPSKLRKVER